MYFHEKTINDIPKGANCFYKAAERGTVLAKESANIWNNSSENEMNMSDIQTKLIQLTGRFCERYASDLICTLSSLQAFIKPRFHGDNKQWIIPVGIRKDGVDHEAFILSRLEETITNPYTHFVHVEHEYRKLLVIDIQDFITPDYPDYPCMERTVKLIDITNSLHTLED